MASQYRTVRTKGGYAKGAYSTGGNSGWEGFTSDQYKAGAAGMNLVGSYFEANRLESDAKYGRTVNNIQSRQLLRNAKARRAAGTREAQQYSYQGREIESNAINTMVAQGGTVDPLLLAKLKQRSSYNSLAALFEAETEAGALEMQSVLTKSAGEMNVENARATGANQKLAATVNFASTLFAFA